MTNLLNDTTNNLTFNQYSISDFWTGSVDGEGYPILSAEVDTLDGVPYELEFSVAANLAANAVDVEIEISFAGTIIGTINHSGALFAEQSLTFMGTGETDTLQFRILDNTGGSGEGNVDTSGVIPSYEKTVTFLGQEITVDAFMPGQGLVYQVLGGKLVKFDLATNTYEDLEYQNSFNVNSIGFSAQYDLIFGQARGNGTDVNGNSVSDGDLIAFDARGKLYKVAETPYQTYIGDIDGNGDLWIFPAGISTAYKLDFDNLDENNQPVTVVYDIPNPTRPTSGLADLAFNPTTKTFYGVAHGGSGGTNPTLFAVDISGVELGEGIELTETPIAGTIVDGVTKPGIPTSAYGAAMVDGDGNVYAGANNADHDLNSNTPNSGGFYKLITGEDGNVYMELLAASPTVTNNDGAMDTRGFDPFLGIDGSSTVLLKEPVLSVALAEDDLVALSAKGSAKTIDLLANDSVTEGESLTVTKINGSNATAGMQVTLQNGETAVYNGDGTLTVTPAELSTNVVGSLTYTIENDNGVTDTALVTVATSPVDGTAGNDSMMLDYTDADGNQIQQADGEDDVILGYGGNDKIFAGSGDDVIYGGSGADFMRAHSGDDYVEGGAGNDILDGGLGADTLRGGDDDDLYYVDNAEDDISETGATGHDKVYSTLSYTLASEFEDLWLIKGSSAIEGHGNGEQNTIVGNENDNLLKGYGGNDYMLAGAGDDTMYGGAADDNLQGGYGDDLQYGGDGNDKLHGQDGDDIQYGGSGADTLCPNFGDDTMYGGEGDDLLAGRNGDDVAYGGAGDDMYKVESGADQAIEYADEGYDTVHAMTSFTLGEHVERLRLTGTGALDGVGNSSDNRLIGNGSVNNLSGLAGDDHLNGMGGDDVMLGGSGSDRMFGNAGNDWLEGGSEADNLAGNMGQDSLYGGQGNDRLFGGGGA
ncbi:MAG: hypothetical protein HRU31_18150, partial [Rhodobacteraceae bacterium]|nr:hypothetical protein [Paracoccaceae bacterium]